VPNDAGQAAGSAQQQGTSSRVQAPGTCFSPPLRI
jgi:hypothetical protein